MTPYVTKTGMSSNWLAGVASKGARTPYDLGCMLQKFGEKLTNTYFYNMDLMQPSLYGTVRDYGWPSLIFVPLPLPYPGDHQLFSGPQKQGPNLCCPILMV